MDLSKPLNDGIKKFDEIVLKNGCRVNDVDECVYTKFVADKGVIIYL